MKHVNFTTLKELDYKTNESYKTLRTNISFCGDDVKAICFTSSIPNEGKSRVSFLTAKALAEDGKRVLYIDADIRKSILVARYDVDEEVIGLTHYLAGKNKLEEVIYETNINKLHAIFTGASVPNPSELLGKHRFETLIQTMREAYDYIVIDCPPLGSVIDAAIVARHCDGAVIVVEAGNVSYHIVQKVKEQLDKSGCQILGVILNKVEMSSKGYGYGYGKYYGRYYGKYYGKYYSNYGEYGKSNDKE